MSWRLDEKLRTAVEAYFDTQAVLTPEQFEVVKGYCLYVVKAPCYYESQDEEVRLRLESALLRRVKTKEELQQWIGEAVRFGIDPF